MADGSTESARRTARQRTADAVDCIRRLVTVLGESARTVEQRTGLTNAQLFVLRQLQRDELTINELAARTMTQQSTVSLVVRRLEHAGYVKRERSRADARQVCVTLTARGRAVAKRAPQPPLARTIDALETIPAADVDALIQSLGTLLTAMHAPAMSTPLFETSGGVRLTKAKSSPARRAVAPAKANTSRG